MKGRIAQIVLLALSLLLAGVTTASFSRPLHAVIPFGASARHILSVGDGQCRIVRLTPVYSMSYFEGRTADTWAGRWLLRPVESGEWYDQSYATSEGFILYARVRSFPLLLPILGVLFVLIIVRVRAKQPGRLARLFMEIVHRSDRIMKSRIRRFCRRCLVLAFGLCTTAIAVAMIAPIPFLNCLWPVLSLVTSSWMIPHPNRAELQFVDMGQGVSSRVSLSLVDQKLNYTYSNRALKDQLPKSRRIAFAGFRMEIVTLSLPNAPRLSTAKGYFDQTETYFCHATVPMVFPLMLSSLPPIILFICGPWRRSKRSLYGWCLKCGYDLTGLLEPRCPECGTATRPAKIQSETDLAVSSAV